MITDQLVQAFSWMLIHSLWQGLLLSVITGVVLMLTKRSSSAIRYNLILLQLLLFITGCVFTFAWEWQQNQLQTVDFLHLQADNIKQYTQTVISYFSANAPMVLLLWFVLFIARAVKMMGGLAYIRRARYKNIYSPEDYWKNKIVLLCEQLQIKKAVTLFESGYVKMPLVIGHFKPVILIPVGLLAGLPSSQVEAVLLHELAHIRRNDYCVNLLQNITEAIFFFNPGLLWISSLLRDEREHCCDDIALAQTKNKREFIEALISFKEHSNNYAVAFPGKKNHLLQRVSRIIHNKNNTLNPIEKVFFMTGILILAVMVTAAGVMEVKTIVKEEEHVVSEQQQPVQKPVIVKHKKIKPVKVVREVKPVQPTDAEEAERDREEAIRDKKQELSDNEQEVRDRELLLRDKEHAREQSIRDKEQAQRDREQAVKDREQAVKDRMQADRDRMQADRDRAQADKDRAQARRDMEQAKRDRLQADREREQAMRDKQPQ
ncbi:Signal transducer regulating beta-lactamase production, contains metallopeptidase domain [Chitinophaga sp. YR573]|uniref:M56 family metallopeptidase n=1 Tax=Chitinophaga sp. YR573 TaxID=1881040 RepID=UPI0008AE9996|nr:M56 family metallopeptidase [Chitinophaga sp. YR573]SEW44418.1 Signal transducer regulating beta-lactamase production, contains metallopeptidase domain [Chitinophaga sp. YR573]